MTSHANMLRVVMCFVLVVSAVNDCQTTLEASQEQLKQCKLALEGKVDA